MNINERVKHVRLIVGLSQSAYSDKLKITQSKLARIEKEKIAPHMSILNNICLVFDVSPDWLIKEKGAIFNDGTNIYKKRKDAGMLYDPNLLESIIIEIDDLMSDDNIIDKARVINYYFEHYRDKNIDDKTRKQEISNSIKFVHELLEDRS